MSKPKEPQFEDVEFLTRIKEKLDEGEATLVSHMLCEWAYAVGYVKGMLAVIEKDKESKP